MSSTPCMNFNRYRHCKIRTHRPNSEHHHCSVCARKAAKHSALECPLRTLKRLTTRKTGPARKTNEAITQWLHNNVAITGNSNARRLCERFGSNAESYAYSSTCFLRSSQSNQLNRPSIYEATVEAITHTERLVVIVMAPSLLDFSRQSEPDHSEWSQETAACWEHLIKLAAKHKKILVKIEMTPHYTDAHRSSKLYHKIQQTNTKLPYLQKIIELAAEIMPQTAIIGTNQAHICALLALDTITPSKDQQLYCKHNGMHLSDTGYDEIIARVATALKPASF